MQGRFRLAPPSPGQDGVARPRLIRRLARRFELPVVVIAAPAGYGKTSVLSQAIALASVDGSGRDLWLQCEPADADPAEFVTAVLQACSVEIGSASGGDAGVDTSRLVDALARFAPQSVCLVLDDVHRISRESPTWRLIESLLDDMPSNAHVLFCGRTHPPIALARRYAAGAVEQLGVRDLEFDDSELAACGIEVQNRLGEAARWPAVVALGRHDVDPATFIAEEVIAAWPADRRVALTALAHLGEIDDEIALAASGGRATASELIADLPLVHRSSAGTFRLHDLWYQALTGADRNSARAVTSDARKDIDAALRRIAHLLLDRGDQIGAAELFASAGDEAGLVAAALTFVAQPFVRVMAGDLARISAIVSTELGSHPAAELLLCAHFAVKGDERVAAERFEQVARSAARIGVQNVESLALQQAVNMRSILDPDSIPEWLVVRSGLLAATHPAAAVASVMARFHVARASGRPDAAVAVLSEVVPATTARQLVTYAFGMIDLGRPEQIDAVFDAAALHAGDSALQLDLAVGTWLRGGVSPEAAMQFGTPLVSTADTGGFPHVEVPTHATFSLIALSAGDVAAARRYADTAVSRSSATASVPVHAFALLADAACTFCERGDAAARPLFDALLDRLPIGLWPGRPYLFAMPTVYALAPAARAPLDACRFGPALSAALDAGRAIVALLERNDPGPAGALAWNRPALLRAHVLPPHLAALGAAAAAAGHGEVGRLLEQLPAAREHLAAVATVGHASTARWAARRITTMPARPEYDLYVDVLGPVRLRRGATTVIDAAWSKRDRVRQLLVYLSQHRQATRRSIGEALWPDLAPDKAAANLRVNLTHLQKVLQPTRSDLRLPWFVEADGEWLRLTAVGVEVDVDRFDALQQGARRLDDQGRSRQALQTYLAALKIVRGEYLGDWPDAGWAEIERMRLRALVIGARCRSGELLLVLGEPELAARHAGQVLADEPLQERAGRLLSRALASQGDRATARSALQEVLARLVRQGITPEPETISLARAHGIG